MDARFESSKQVDLAVCDRDPRHTVDMLVIIENLRLTQLVDLIEEYNAGTLQVSTDGG